MKKMLSIMAAVVFLAFVAFASFGCTTTPANSTAFDMLSKAMDSMSGSNYIAFTDGSYSFSTSGYMDINKYDDDYTNDAIEGGFSGAILKGSEDPADLQLAINLTTSGYTSYGDSDSDSTQYTLGVYVKDQYLYIDVGDGSNDKVKVSLEELETSLDSSDQTLDADQEAEMLDRINATLKNSVTSATVDGSNITLEIDARRFIGGIFMLSKLESGESVSDAGEEYKEFIAYIPESSVTVAVSLSEDYKITSLEVSSSTTIDYSGALYNSITGDDTFSQFGGLGDDSESLGLDYTVNAEFTIKGISYGETGEIDFPDFSDYEDITSYFNSFSDQLNTDDGGSGTDYDLNETNTDKSLDYEESF
ncbi:MAG: hypothetical protein ACOYIK_09525 [Coriobacteriales bacterium]